MLAVGDSRTGEVFVPKKLLVHIDIARLRANMSEEDGRPWSDQDVRRWLTDAGFAATRHDRWLVEEADLGQLDPSEVTSADDAPD